MADLRAEMSKFMSGNKETPSDTPATEKVEETVENETDTVDQPEDSDDQEKKPLAKKKEEEEDTDEDKDEEKEEKDDKSKEKSAKPNRYQRVKKQRDEALAQVAEREQYLNKAVKTANAWRQEAILLEKELKSVLDKAKSAGFNRSHDEDRAFLSERELANVKLEKEFDEHLKKETLQKQAIAMKEKFKQEFIESAHDLSTKYGVHPKKLMTAYYAELEAGEKVTMEDVAKDMGELETFRKRKSANQTQIQTNESAPRVVKPGKSVGVDYPATSEGMKRWLIAQGHANKD